MSKTPGATTRSDRANAAFKLESAIRERLRSMLWSCGEKLPRTLHEAAAREDRGDFPAECLRRPCLLALFDCVSGHADGCQLPGFEPTRCGSTDHDRQAEIDRVAEEDARDTLDHDRTDAGG